MAWRCNNERGRPGLDFTEAFRVFGKNGSAAVVVALRLPKIDSFFVGYVTH